MSAFLLLFLVEYTNKMDNFSEHIGFQVWDGHNNLIGGDGRIVCKRNVCAVNPDAIGSHYDMISKFIEEQYDPKFHILLASGDNITDLQKSMSLKQCKGIGEVFVLKHKNLYTTPIVNYNMLDIVREDSRPVYLHWDMIKEPEWERLEKFLREHPGPVVLCHLGINKEFNNQKSAIKKFKKLQKEYDNLWGEISWDALDWVCKYPESIKGMDEDRIFTASDLAPLDNQNKRELQLASMSGLINSSNNIKRLFKI